MLCQPTLLLGGLLLLATMTTARQRVSAGSRRRNIHRVQHGQCSYTFVLPEPDLCQLAPEALGGSNSLQRDLPGSRVPDLRAQRAQRVSQLEKLLENNTQWLLKVQLGLCGGLAGGQETALLSGGTSRDVHPKTKGLGLYVAQSLWDVGSREGLG